jgi:hypothetical protein
VVSLMESRQAHEGGHFADVVIQRIIHFVIGDGSPESASRNVRLSRCASALFAGVAALNLYIQVLLIFPTLIPGQGVSF